MLSFVLDAALAGGIVFLLLRNKLKTTPPPDGIAGNSNWQLKGSHNSVYLTHDLQAQIDSLKLQNAYLQQQNKRISKQNCGLIHQLEFKNGLLEKYHEQFLKQQKELERKESRVDLLEQRLEGKEKHRFPLLPVPLTA